MVVQSWGTRRDLKRNELAETMGRTVDYVSHHRKGVTEAIVIADSAEAPAGTDAARLKILPPDRESPLGLLRLEAEVQEPIVKVAFYLDERLILTRTRPPYSVEIDLGNVPNYVNNLKRLGFADADIANGGNDRLVDAIVRSRTPVSA